MGDFLELAELALNELYSQEIDDKELEKILKINEDEETQEVA